MSYIIPETLPYPFCPGCGHGTILQRLDAAMETLRLDPCKTVIVTDIGCVGISDKHFSVNTFHGLHGRVLTYATGLKLADPDLTVIALMGDGGAGIGGHHLLSAARRNIGVTLLVFNNMNFGMTGGEHSVTTPCGLATSSTPAGNLERGMDLCRVAEAAGAGFVARGTVFDNDLPDLIAQAIRHDGFSLIDIWELCTAYFVPNNAFSKKGMMDLLGTMNLKTGVLANRDGGEYGALLRDARREGRGTKGVERKGRTTSFPHRLDRRKDLVIAGGAGQKIRSAAGLLGRAAILSGLWATQRDDYPITVMTGHSLAEMSLSPEPIRYIGIDFPDFMIVVSPEGLKKVAHRIAKMRPGSTVMIDERLQSPGTSAEVVPLPFKRAGAGIDKKTAALFALALFLKRTGIVPMEALKEAVAGGQKGEIASANLAVLSAAEKLS